MSRPDHNQQQHTVTTGAGLAFYSKQSDYNKSQSYELFKDYSTFFISLRVALGFMRSIENKRRRTERGDSAPGRD